MLEVYTGDWQATNGPRKDKGMLAFILINGYDVGLFYPYLIHFYGDK